MSVLIRTLGQEQILVGGTPVHWPSRAARSLFSLLLLTPRGLTRGEISELLWGDSPTGESSSTFKVTHFRLRQALGDHSATHEEGGRLALAPQYYRAADHIQFQEALEQAKAAQTGAERLQLLQHALSLYQGDFLPDQNADWTDETRHTLRAAAVRARLEVAKAHCSGVECHAAVRSLAGALAADPLTGERYHQDLMTCLCTLRRTDEAVAHYRHFLTFIQREIGDMPTQETVQLADRIRDGQAHLSRHIGASAPCPRRTLYGDGYIDHMPQPELEALLLEQALDRGREMLGLLRQIGTLDDWSTLTETLGRRLPELLGTPYTGLAPGPPVQPQGSPWPAEVVRAVRASLQQALPGQGRPDGLPGTAAQDGAAATDGTGPEVSVMIQTARTAMRPQFWVWAAWEPGRPVPSAALDLLRGVADVLESVLAQPRWAHTVQP